MARDSMGKRRYPAAIGLLLVLLTLWLQSSQIPVVGETLQRLESLVYDLRLAVTLPAAAVDPRIVIVDIDERSLRTEGQFPWPRDKLARLTEQLFEHGAAVVGFDIVFAEVERNSGASVLVRLDEIGANNPALTRELHALLPRLDNDAAFAATLQGREVVLGYIFHTQDQDTVGTLPLPLAVTSTAVARLSLPEGGHYIGNIAPLQHAARYGGFFSLTPDPDGVIRRAPVVVRHDGQLYPSLGLEVARRFLLLEEVGLQSAVMGGEELLEAIRLGNLTIPTDSRGQAIVPYRGRWGSYPYLSASDVLRGNIPEQRLDNAIVLVGTTAQGLFDLRTTPLQAAFPGVEIHANIIAAILDDDFPMEPEWAAGANFLLTLLFGVTLALWLPRLAPLPLVFVAVAALAMAIVFNFWMWASGKLILTLAPPLLLVTALATFNLAYGYFGEFRGRRLLQGMFGQYVPPERVREMSENPARYGFAGESREMTVLFADIRNFTAISEVMSAHALREMLNHFFTPMTRLIFDHRGTIDKYVGDMVMAFWGAPQDDPRHAVNAIGAALAMLRETERLGPAFAAAGYPRIDIGIGVNSGIMNVGDMGSEYRRAYTVLGDAVNLASRLEGTTKYYEVGLVVGEETRRLAGDAFVYRELDCIRVKGKHQAIRVFQPVCPRNEASDQLVAELQLHDAALACYRSQDWDGAARMFAELHTSRPDVALYRLYLQRIATLRAAPPAADWDGVYERKEK